MENTSIQLCQQSTGQEDDWKNLYETSFPADERMPVEEIRQLLGKGEMMLHKTLNSKGELVCFSLVFPVTDFALLSYIATDATKRSGGYGSKHMKQLIQLLKSQHPSHLRLFLEIESTKEKGLDPEVLKTRNRRLDFYQRLGAKRMCKNYWFANLGAKGGPTKLAELLWIELNGQPVDDQVLQRAIREIYERAYNLPSTDPLIQQVLGQFAATAGNACPVTPPTQATTSTAPAPAEAAQPASSPASAPAGGGSDGGTSAAPAGNGETTATNASDGANKPPTA
jgi:hypothetical protein